MWIDDTIDDITHGKGVVAKDKCPTHFVDNDMDNLWSINKDQNGNCGESIQGLIQYTTPSRRPLEPTRRGHWRRRCYPRG